MQSFHLLLGLPLQIFQLKFSMHFCPPSVLPPPIYPDLSDHADNAWLRTQILKLNKKLICQVDVLLTDKLPKSVTKHIQDCNKNSKLTVEDISARIWVPKALVPQRVDDGDDSGEESSYFITSNTKRTSSVTS
jgi:hypothetical protein